MASTSRPRIYAFKQGNATAIAKGCAVVAGADNSHVNLATSTTVDTIGIAQGASTSAEDKIEVAVPGGGAKGLAQTTITAGQRLTAHTDGSLKPTTGSGDIICAVAMEGAVAGDLFSIEVVSAVATGATQ